MIPKFHSRSFRRWMRDCRQKSGLPPKPGGGMRDCRIPSFLSWCASGIRTVETSGDSISARSGTGSRSLRRPSEGAPRAGIQLATSFSPMRPGVETVKRTALVSCRIQGGQVFSIEKPSSKPGMSPGNPSRRCASKVWQAGDCARRAIVQTSAPPLCGGSFRRIRQSCDTLVNCWNGSADPIVRLWEAFCGLSRDHWGPAFYG